MSRILMPLLLLQLLSLPGFCSEDRPPSGTSIYEQVLPATVWIVSFTDVKAGKAQVGTGVLVDRSRRLVVTAYHCVNERPDAIVFFARRGNDGRVLTTPKAYTGQLKRHGIKGRVVAKSKGHDLAVIRLDRIPAGARALPLAKDSPRPGELLHCIGNSGSEEGTLWRYSSGRVRQVYVRELKYKTGQRVTAMMVESQIPTNCGDSGGPWVNDRAEVVAIVTGGGKEQLVEYGIDVTVIRKLKMREGTLGNVVRARPGNRPQPTRPQQWNPGALTPPVPTTIPAPLATVRNVRVLHNVQRNGVKGMQVNCDVIMDGLRGIPCKVELIVCDRSRKAYMGNLPGYRTERGYLGESQGVLVRDHRARINGVTLFLPYAAIEAVVPSRESMFFVSVDVFSLASSRFVAQRPWWESVVRNTSPGRARR